MHNLGGNATTPSQENINYSDSVDKMNLTKKDIENQLSELSINDN